MTDLKECDEKLRLYSEQLAKGKTSPSQVMVGINKLLDYRLELMPKHQSKFLPKAKPN